MIKNIANRLSHEKKYNNKSYLRTLKRYFFSRVMAKISPRFHWRYDINKTILEINLTNECNLKCPNCCSSCPQAPNKEYISLNQIKKFINESKEINWKWSSIKLYGGEPTMHPHFLEVLDILEPYANDHPETKISMITNGVSEKTKQILKKAPKWLEVSNSTEKGMDKKFQFFESYNIAPADIKKYKKADFTKGCWRIEGCGLALGKHGYYICAPGYHVDRVFGFDIGIKELKNVNEKELRKQANILCKFCGLYKEPKHVVKTQVTSKSWKRAYKKYSEKQPVLKEY